MATVFLPELVIDASSAEEGIKTLFKSVKPEWNQEQIIIKKMSGGFTCLSSCVYLDGNPDDAYTVRVRDILSAENDTSNLANPEFEVKVVQELAKIGLFPTVPAVFKNGFCYGYIKGKPIIDFSQGRGMEPGSEQRIKKTMVQKLAEINSIKLEFEDYSRTNFFTNIEKSMENYPTDNPDFIDKALISKEFYELLDYSIALDFKIGFCHGDVHPGNVVWNMEDGRMTYIDWELAHIGYLAYDVASCVQTFHFADIMPIPGAPPASKDEESLNESRMEIVKWYFEKWSDLNSLKFDEESFKDFWKQVTFFELVWCVIFMILNGAYPNTPDTIGHELPPQSQLVRNAYDYYCSIKEKRLQYLNIKIKR